MNFIDAIHAAKEGKKIRRNCWDGALYLFWNNECYLRFWKDSECIQNKEIELTLWDYIATDWEIVSEKKELSREDLERAWNKFICTEEREFTKAEFSMSFGYFCKELGL